MPAAKARKHINLLSAMLAAEPVPEAEKRKNTEDALRQDIEQGRHTLSEHQFEVGAFLMWLTMTSKEAREAPDAKGFVLEFSRSPLSSRNPKHTTIYFTGSPRAATYIGPGFPEPVNDMSPPDLKEQYVHYWTERDPDAVVRLTERIRTETQEARSRVRR